MAPKARSTLAPWRVSPTPHGDEAEAAEERHLDPEREARRLARVAQIRQYPDPVLRMRAKRGRVFRRRAGAARRAHGQADGGRATARASPQPGRRPPPCVRHAHRRGRRTRGRSSTPSSLRAPTRSTWTTRAACRFRACWSRSSGRVGDGEGEDPHGRCVTLELDGFEARAPPTRARPSGRRAHDRPHDGRGAA